MQKRLAGCTGSGLLSRAPLSFVAVAIALAACDSVLGLDPPTLDPCASGCTDGAVDASLDGEADAHADVAADAKADTAAPTGVRCGGGSFPTSYCEDPTAVCCQTTDDAGTTSYTCVASTSACDGYPIACATDNDCPGSDVCCHFSTSMKCEGSRRAPTRISCAIHAPPTNAPPGGRATSSSRTPGKRRRTSAAHSNGTLSHTDAGPTATCARAASPLESDPKNHRSAPPATAAAPTPRTTVATSPRDRALCLAS